VSISSEEDIDLDKEVLRRERESAVVNSGRDYARRVVGYKRMLSQPIGTRRRSPTPPRRRSNRSLRKAIRSPSRSASPKREVLTKAFSQETRNRLCKLKDDYGQVNETSKKSSKSDTIRLGFQ